MEQQSNKISNDMYLALRSQFANLPNRELKKIETVSRDFGRHQMVVIAALRDEFNRRKYYEEKVS